MKKTLVLVGGVVFAALLAVSCGNKQAAEENAEAVEEVVEEVVAEPAAEVVVDDAELLSAAQKAGLAKCNCYNSETKSVNDDCIDAIFAGVDAAYKDNQKFIDEMEKTYKNCIKEKAEAAAKDAAKEGANKAADALAKKLAK
ncbi:MAG: hypothetical protein E7076_08020 [Bacteroidales bacterium]|nr:hypothetical protein [Bacteroidales bacterium]